MANATDSSAHSPRARGGPHLRLGADTLAAVMVAAPAVLLMIWAVWGIVTGWASPGSFLIGLYSFILFGGGPLILLLAVGIARHARMVQTPALFLCAAISLRFLSMAGVPDLGPIAVGVGAYAGVAAILLFVALRQKGRPVS